eukprot:TRINITY_DN3966_c3_g1_i1.p1 TRINITY_DN3966_c3_g1~~TRINITY_DN3966_c3_g1_i1.p1  ORF type:complete len:332 (+),score=36.11 TRINITY_DN3966_c3_g1_i1:84-998(+)
MSAARVALPSPSSFVRGDNSGSHGSEVFGLSFGTAVTERQESSSSSASFHSALSGSDAGVEVWARFEESQRNAPARRGKVNASKRRFSHRTLRRCRCLCCICMGLGALFMAFRKATPLDDIAVADILANASVVPDGDEHAKVDQHLLPELGMSWGTTADISGRSGGTVVQQVVQPRRQRLRAWQPRSALSWRRQWLWRFMALVIGVVLIALSAEPPIGQLAAGIPFFGLLFGRIGAAKLGWFGGIVGAGMGIFLSFPVVLIMCFIVAPLASEYFGRLGKICSWVGFMCIGVLPALGLLAVMMST